MPPNTIVPKQDGSQRFSQILHPWEDLQFGWILLIALAAAALVFVVRRVLPWVAGKLPERFRFYILPWVPVLRLLILIAAIVQIVPLIIKPTADNLFALLGASALAIGFAFKEYASSIIAGVVALYEQPYRAGDWISVDGAYGEVRSLGLRALTMVTPDNTVVTVPHSKIWETPIENENAGHRELQCVADFYLQPDHDGDAVRRALWDVGVTSPYLLLDRPVLVVACEKPWGTHYRLKAYPIDGRDQFLFLTDLTMRGKAQLRHLGVPFATATAVAESAGKADLYGGSR